MVLQKENGIFDTIGNHISLIPLDISSRMADPDVQDRAILFDLVFPDLPFIVFDGMDLDRGDKGLPKFIPVFERNLPVDAVPGPVKFDVNRLLNRKRRIRMDRDIGVKFGDGKKLGKDKGREKG